MFVGVARFVLQIPGSRSLKDRRRVVLSFKDRARARLGVAVAEIGDAGKIQVATLGVACVSGDAVLCRELLDKVRHLASGLPDAILADARSEVVSFANAGSGIDVRPAGAGST